MPDNTERWFRLKDDYGVDAAGNLEPLIPSTSFTFPEPVMTAGGVVMEKGIATANVLDGTRLLSTTHPGVAMSVQMSGIYEEIDPPDSKAKKEALEVTRPHRERAHKRNESLAAQAQKQHTPVAELAELPENQQED